MPSGNSPRSGSRPGPPRSIGRAEFPEDIRQLLAEQDVLGLPFPVEYGGVGGDLLTVCVAVEEIAKACATSSLILIVQSLGSLPITDRRLARAAGPPAPGPGIGQEVSPPSD